LVSNRFRGSSFLCLKWIELFLTECLVYGGVMVAASFEFIGSSHRNDRWRRFC
jgi:hypothetical protein